MKPANLCPECRKQDPNRHAYLYPVYGLPGTFHCPTCHAQFYKNRGRWERLF